MGGFHPFVHVNLTHFPLSVIVCVYSAALPPSIRAPRVVRARTVRMFHLSESRHVHFPKGSDLRRLPQPCGRF